ncbi:MAG: Rieske (2Fe-2S) iron-sulfur domain protein [Microvirga sp.]|nr:Rieske (2Fe-2S) iron-sulfur domain protein [Microvirga sp.]
MEKRRLAVGPLGDFPVGKFRIVSIDGVEIGIVRLAGGALHAVRNRCPHKGAPVCKGILGGTWPPSAVGELAFERDGEVLVCPWHGYEFDLNSGLELYQKRPTRLRKYDVGVEDGQVFVLI